MKFTMWISNIYSLDKTAHYLFVFLEFVKNVGLKKYFCVSCAYLWEKKHFFIFKTDFDENGKKWRKNLEIGNNILK